MIIEKKRTKSLFFPVFMCDPEPAEIIGRTTERFPSASEQALSKVFSQDDGKAGATAREAGEDEEIRGF